MTGLRLDFIDFPAGWLLQEEIGSAQDAHLDPRCSAVQTNGAVLCDCGAIAVQWARSHGGQNWERYVPAGLLESARALVAAGVACRPMHPAIAEILEHFEFSHLPDELAEVSRGFHEQAHRLVDPEDKGGFGLEGAEATVALRKLLEGKDAAVRARRQKLKRAAG